MTNRVSSGVNFSSKRKNRFYSNFENYGVFGFRACLPDNCNDALRRKDIQRPTIKLDRSGDQPERVPRGDQ